MCGKLWEFCFGSFNVVVTTVASLGFLLLMEFKWTVIGFSVGYIAFARGSPALDRVWYTSVVYTGGRASVRQASAEGYPVDIRLCTTVRHSRESITTTVDLPASAVELYTTGGYAGVKGVITGCALPTLTLESSLLLRCLLLLL